MRIGLVTMESQPTRISPLMPEVARLLDSWGAEIEQIHPDEQLAELIEIKVRHDLYVLKAGSELALSLAGALHSAGARILNPYPTAATCRDKVVATRILQSAGVPVPETYVAARPERLAALLDDGPLVVKPHRGTQGNGVRVVWDADQLDEMVPSGGVVFAQRYHRPEGRDRKIYCIGGQLFCVKRIWPAQTYEEKVGEPFALSDELRAIALRCGEAFGIDVFGLDIILSEGKPYVVDISSFPGFKGVPDAALRLADYIYAAAERVLSGGPTVAGDGVRRESIVQAQGDGVGR